MDVPSLGINGIYIGVYSRSIIIIVNDTGFDFPHSYFPFLGTKHIYPSTYTMPSSITLLPLLALLTLSYAAPFDVNNPDTQTTAGPGPTVIDFAPKVPTCATDPAFLTAKGKDLNTATVNTREDCNDVVLNICSAAIRKAFPSSHEAVNLQNGIYSKVGTCEGHMLFPWVSAPRDFMIDECTAAFNAVEGQCLLMGDATFPNSVVPGRQAGAMNVYWNPQEWPYWFPEIHRTPTEPGYLLGPVGYWGDLGDDDAVSVPK